MSIFFDLDGTLIDSKLRLFNLFQELIPQADLSFEEYWALKQNKIDHKTIIANHFENINYSEFESNWMNLIETRRYLNIDIPFPGVDLFLKKFKLSGECLYIITARQSMDGVNYQIEKFGWTTYFKKILVTEQKYSKTDLIRPFLSDCNKDWIIGDTGNDILVGKTLNIKTAAVSSGFLSSDILKEYNPDILLSNVTDFHLYI